MKSRDCPKPHEAADGFAPLAYLRVRKPRHGAGTSVTKPALLGRGPPDSEPGCHGLACPHEPFRVLAEACSSEFPSLVTQRSPARDTERPRGPAERRPPGRQRRGNPAGPPRSAGERRPVSCSAAAASTGAQPRGSHVSADVLPPDSVRRAPTAGVVPGGAGRPAETGRRGPRPPGACFLEEGDVPAVPPYSRGHVPRPPAAAGHQGQHEPDRRRLPTRAGPEVRFVSRAQEEVSALINDAERF